MPIVGAMMSMMTETEAGAGDATQSKTFKAISLFCKATLGISVLLVLLAAVFFMVFALPANDDFVRATRPRELGWWGYVFGFTYMKWQGRWASCGLESYVLPRIEITQYYWTLLAGIALVEYLATFAVVRSFARGSSRRSVAATSLVIVALLWAGLPSPAEAIYWFTGAVENALVVALATLLLIMLCQPTSTAGPTDRPRASRLACLVAAPFAFLIVSFHELFGTMLLMALVTGTGMAFWNRRYNRFVWLLAVVGAVVGLIIVVAAPGNSYRFATDGGPHSRQLKFGLHIMLSQFRFYPHWWLQDPKLIAATVWVFCYGCILARHRTGPMSRAQKQLIWVGPVVWLVMISFGFYLPSWALGAAMPLRTLSGNYLVFVAGWLVIVCVWSQYLGGSISPAITTTGQRITEIALAVSLLLTGHFRDAITDYRFNVYPWHDAVQDRYAILRQETHGDARVTPLPSAAQLLYPGETVTPGPVIFTKSMIAYFNLKSFNVIPPPARDPPPAKLTPGRFRFVP